jgi:hypothetical protein
MSPAGAAAAVEAVEVAGALESMGPMVVVAAAGAAVVLLLAAAMVVSAAFVLLDPHEAAIKLSAAVALAAHRRRRVDVIGVLLGWVVIKESIVGYSRGCE